MSDARRTSLALNIYNPISHNAYKNMLLKNENSDNANLNRSNYNYSLKNLSVYTKPNRKNYSSIIKYNNSLPEYRPMNYSTFIFNHNKNKLPFKLTGNRFAWQTSIVEREILNKIAKTTKLYYETNKKNRNFKRCVSAEHFNTTSLNPKYLPNETYKPYVRLDYIKRFKSTSSVISIKDKMNEKEPEYKPLKHYHHYINKIPGIIGLIKKTPKDVPVNRKKSTESNCLYKDNDNLIIKKNTKEDFKRTIINDDSIVFKKPTFNQNKEYNIYLSHMKGGSFVPNDHKITEKEYQNSSNNKNNNLSCSDIFTKKTIKIKSNNYNKENYEKANKHLIDEEHLINNKKKISNKQLVNKQYNFKDNKVVKFQDSNSIKNAFDYKQSKKNKRKEVENHFTDNRKELLYKRNKNSTEDNIDSFPNTRVYKNKSSINIC